MKLWLDDVRPAPEGWTWAKTPEQAIAHLKTGEVTHASLDHDLGISPERFEAYTRGEIAEHEAEMTGYEVILWMEANECWPTQEISLHTSNPAAYKRMKLAITRAQERGVCP